MKSEAASELEGQVYWFVGDGHAEHDGEELTEYAGVVGDDSVGDDLEGYLRSECGSEGRCGSGCLRFGVG